MFFWSEMHGVSHNQARRVTSSSSVSLQLCLEEELVSLLVLRAGEPDLFSGGSASSSSSSSSEAAVTFAFLAALDLVGLVGLGVLGFFLAIILL